MTRGTVFVTAISEALRISKRDAIPLFFRFISATNQDLTIYAEKLARNDGRELLTALRKGQHGIRQWFQPGGIVGLRSFTIASG